MFLRTWCQVTVEGWHESQYGLMSSPGALGAVRGML